MGGLSPMHWLIVVLVVLVLFGPKRLPDLAKGLGKSVTEFKKGVTEETPHDEEQS